jgi:Peptidase family M23
MSNLSKPKLGKFLATIAALSSVTAILVTANKAEAVPMYPNDFGGNTQTVRLQMERTAPNGLPVTINITRSYGLKNGGLLNTWTGTPDGESLYNYITNGSAVNFQSRNGSYSINVPTLEIRDGTRLNTYTSGFSRYQDWNIEKLGGQYGDTYLFHWRTDTNTNLCLDIRGFAPGQSLNNEVPGLAYCDGNNVNQRIRVIKQGQPTPPPPPPPQHRLTMLPGAKLSSNSQCFRLDAQTDGNLVFYNVKALRPIWNSGTNGRSVKSTVFQNDGDLVINDPNNNPIWRLGTNGRGATRLAVQDDGNLVMYNAQNQAVWASNTAQPCGNPPSLPPLPPTSIKPVTNISTIPEKCHFGETCVLSAPQKHTGVDYMNPRGTQVSAICAGTVKYAFPSSTDVWDRFTIVEHKNCGGYGTLYGYYGHINPSVRVGDSVSRGQIIGTIADYPVNNSHLHFGLSTQLPLSGWGYQVGTLSQSGWIDPIVFGRNSGWR